MNLQPYKELAIGMIRTGILGYGGGPSVIPLIRYEAVTRYKWMEDEEFGETLALANALPGPIATKMAAYLGYKRKGISGAIVSVLAHILPSSIAIVALLGVMYTLKDSKYIAGMIAAVRPVIVVMLGIMAYEFALKAWKGLGKGFAVLFGVLAFVLLQLLQIHPGIVVMLFLVYGMFHLNLVQRYKRDKQSDKGVS
ncbi:putative transporter YwrB [Paenibacillus sp. J45TS6]|uniref:Chromate transporter n=1 Tax=Paenibacillus polygoni TaxID=3050112 RepID=A0ABY8X1U4_9BACL|nr:MULTISPECIES: chromate transporter [Paenibacillus]WIV19492.1 chromate transporter [Paenibacillus polygoni]GIP44331.1 putative transporter YwrB [Paenibacillus sp. J45TS6]